MVIKNKTAQCIFLFLFMYSSVMREQIILYTSYLVRNNIFNLKSTTAYTHATILGNISLSSSFSFSLQKCFQTSSVGHSIQFNIACMVSI